MLAHQVGMFAHRLGEGAEDDALFGQRLAEGGFDRHRIEDRIYGHHAGQGFPLVQGDAQFLEGFGQGRIDFFGAVGILLGCRVIDNILIINGRHLQVPPRRLLHLLPFAESV